MMKSIKRRDFIHKAVAGIGMGMALPNEVVSIYNFVKIPEGHKVGIIGLDTSHSIAFTKILNNAAASTYNGYRVVAAYPYGSRKIESSANRIPEYVDEIKKHGVEIVDSIEELLKKVDAVLLESNDGRLHLEQATQVFRAGKRVFIDKPFAASLHDVIAIYESAKKYNVPVFSSSSLRYIAGAKEIVNGSVGSVLGVESYSPALIEKTHPDLFWYGIHGVEILYTIMGMGCKSIVRFSSEDTDVVTGKWHDGRIASFRGIRAGARGFGATVYGEKEITVLDGFNGYEPLLNEITQFFHTGKPPVCPEETIEIYAFMEAADESKRLGGIPIFLNEVLEEAKKS